MNYTHLEKTTIKYSQTDALNAATIIAKERNMERTGHSSTPAKENTLTLEQLNQQSDAYLRTNFRNTWVPRNS